MGVSAAELPSLPDNCNTHTSLHTYLHIYLPNHTAPSLCCFFCLAFAFSFLAEGLKTDLILRAPPRYSHVHTNTTAKLNMM
jgi:hypothetical protein